MTAFATLVLVTGCGGGDNGNAVEAGQPTGNRTEGSTTEQAAGAADKKPANGDAPPQSKSGRHSSGKGGEKSDGSNSKSGNAPQRRASGDGTSKAKFIRQADRICAKTSTQVENRLKPYFEKGLDKLEQQSSAMIDRVVAPSLEAEVAAIRRLDSPTDGGAELEAVLIAIEESADQARANPTEFIVGKRPFAASERAVKSYGFHVCGGI